MPSPHPGRSPSPSLRRPGRSPSPSRRRPGRRRRGRAADFFDDGTIEFYVLLKLEIRPGRGGQSQLTGLANPPSRT